jgi:hypothetical protein
LLLLREAATVPEREIEVEMTGWRPELTVVAGSGRTEKIALSLVHASARIDIPASAIHRIEVHEYSRFSKLQPPLPDPHVEVYLRFDIRARVRRLTRGIVGEPLEILVDGKSVSKPIVREPLDNLNISIFDLDEAQALAAQLRARCSITRPRPI